MLKTLNAYSHPIEAHIVAGRLNLEGIPTVILYENHIWANWLISLAIGGVKIQVPEAALEEATIVLNKLEHGLYQQLLLNTTETTPELERCQSCQLEVDLPVHWSWRLSLFTLLLFYFPLPYQSQNRHCPHCAKKWRQQPTLSISIPIIYSTLTTILLLALLGFALFFIAVLVEQLNLRLQ